jgi:hypothetical protein
MNFYIETENGVPKNHPAAEDNLLQVFGLIPTHWEPFVRAERPLPGIYEIIESNDSVYKKINNVWTDVCTIRPMTVEEKTARQQNVITAFNAYEQAENWSTWTFDETICAMVPPVPRPELSEGGFLYWCGADNNWKEAPARPEGDYKFDYLAWQWVVL